MFFEVVALRYYSVNNVVAQLHTARSKTNYLLAVLFVFPLKFIDFYLVSDMSMSTTYMFIYCFINCEILMHLKTLSDSV